MQKESNDLLYLLRILESINKIILYSTGYTTADEFIFSNDQKDYNASLLLMINIGEQSTKISSETKDKFPEILWQHLKSFRNRVAHDYVNVDKLIVFSVIRNELPKLQVQISNCIKEQVTKGTFNKNELEISSNSIYYAHIDFAKLT